MYRYWHRYRPIMQLSYRYRHRYRPIWKSDISVVIGIGRYEKMLIGRPLILESSRCLGSTKKNSQNKCPFCILILLHLLAQLPRVEWGVSAINPDSNQAFSFRLHSLQCMNSFWIQEKVILHDELVFETSKFSKGRYN